MQKTLNATRSTLNDSPFCSRSIFGMRDHLFKDTTQNGLGNPVAVVERGWCFGFGVYNSVKISSCSVALCVTDPSAEEGAVGAQLVHVERLARFICISLTHSLTHSLIHSFSSDKSPFGKRIPELSAGDPSSAPVLRLFGCCAGRGSGTQLPVPAGRCPSHPAESARPWSLRH